MLHEDVWLSSYFPQNKAYRVTSPFSDPIAQKGFFYARVGSQDLKAHQALLHQQFKLAEISMQFRQKLPVDKQRKNNCRFSENRDQDQVLAIGEKSFVHSRFYTDPKIGMRIASRIKHDWLLNYFLGNRGTKMIVATDHDEVTGFLLLLDRTIDLIATSEKHRGKGIASDLIHFANEHVAGLLNASTQNTNLPSIQMYISNGFELAETQYVFHLHH